MSVLAELEHVSKSYGRVKALDDVTLKVREGEVFALIGPNGSGKTTLLRVLACLEKPDAGNVYVGGEKVDEGNRNRIKLDTTMVFQRTTMFRGSVYDNVAYGLRMRRASEDEADDAVRKALRMVRLEGYEKRQAKRLSGGEQQRVSLARALVLSTPLLFLDEPTANLDPKNASIIEEVIRQVNRQGGTTIVMATHNIFQVEQTAEKAALIMNGRIVEVGGVEEILRSESKGLAKFARLENIFSGTAEISEEGTSRIKLDNGIAIESTLQESGRITVFVRPEDIIVSRSRFESSARNVFGGKIVEVSDFGSLVRLSVEVDGGEWFVAQITKKSLVEMGLNVGSPVYLTFKASSVQLV
jgi:tungstate transport system ATP-binding protein